jgi:hypothetical protein
MGAIMTTNLNSKEKKQIYIEKLKKFISDEKINEILEKVDNIFSFRFNIILYPLLGFILSVTISLSLGRYFESLVLGLVLILTLMPIYFGTIGLIGLVYSVEEIKGSLVFLIEYVYALSKKLQEIAKEESGEKLAFKDAVQIVIKTFIIPAVKVVAILFLWYIPIILFIKDTVIKAKKLADKEVPGNISLEKKESSLFDKEIAKFIPKKIITFMSGSLVVFKVLMYVFAIISFGIGIILSAISLIILT